MLNNNRNIIIGTSYYGISNRFRNPIGITHYFPSGTSLPEERKLQWLAPPFEIVKKFSEGSLPREALKEIYLEILLDENFRLKMAMQDIIEKFGKTPVFLGCSKDPLHCYRSIFAEAVTEVTGYEVREVTSQHELHNINIEKIIAKYNQ